MTQEGGRSHVLFDANEYLIAGLENQAEWWEHLGDAHRDYAALARVALAAEDELERVREASERVVKEFTMWAEDWNDGTYAYWKSDGLMMACVELRKALAASPDTEEEQR